MPESCPRDGGAGVAAEESSFRWRDFLNGSDEDAGVELPMEEYAASWTAPSGTGMHTVEGMAESDTYLSELSRTDARATGGWRNLWQSSDLQSGRMSGAFLCDRWAPIDAPIAVVDNGLTFQGARAAILGEHILKRLGSKPPRYSNLPAGMTESSPIVRAVRAANTKLMTAIDPDWVEPECDAPPPPPIRHSHFNEQQPPPPLQLQQHLLQQQQQQQQRQRQWAGVRPTAAQTAAQQRPRAHQPARQPPLQQQAHPAGAVQVPQHPPAHHYHQLAQFQHQALTQPQATHGVGGSADGMQQSRQWSDMETTAMQTQQRKHQHEAVVKMAYEGLEAQRAGREPTVDQERAIAYCRRLKRHYQEQSDQQPQQPQQPQQKQQKQKRQPAPKKQAVPAKKKQARPKPAAAQRLQVQAGPGMVRSGENGDREASPPVSPVHEDGSPIAHDSPPMLSSKLQPAAKRVPPVQQRRIAKAKTSKPAKTSVAVKRRTAMQTSTGNIQSGPAQRAYMLYQQQQQQRLQQPAEQYEEEEVEEVAPSRLPVMHQAQWYQQQAALAQQRQIELQKQQALSVQ